MPRGIFNPEGEFLRKLYEEKRGEDKDEPSEIDEEPTEELPDEEEIRTKKYQKAAERYEEALTRPFHPAEIEAEEKSKQQDKKIVETHKPSGLKSRTARRTWRYGHRHGGKPRKPGREAARKEARKEAA